MDAVTLTRLQLYKLVWAEPLSTLCKRYQISDVGLRKICIRLAIPLPEMGYWNKVKAGKKVRQQPYTDRKDVEQQVTLNLATDAAHAGKDAPSAFELLQKEIETDPSLDLTVKTTLSDPDPLVARAQKALVKKEPYYREGNLRYAGPGELRISVTPGLINRALCLLDTFIKAMKQRGHHFRVTDHESYLVLGKAEMEMKLTELSTRVTIEGTAYPQTETHPNGRLAMKFKRWGTTTEIKDGKDPLEQQLSRLIAKLEILGEQFRLQEIEWEKQRAVAAAKRLQEEAFKARRSAEFSAFQQALKDSARWQQTVQLRAYIEHIGQKATENNQLTQELQVWLDWIKAKADWLDPLVKSPDPWLEGIEPDALLNSITPALENPRYGYAPQLPKQKPWPLLPWYLKKD